MCLGTSSTRLQNSLRFPNNVQKHIIGTTNIKTKKCYRYIATILYLKHSNVSETDVLNPKQFTLDMDH